MSCIDRFWEEDIELSVSDFKKSDEAQDSFHVSHCGFWEEKRGDDIGERIQALEIYTPLNRGTGHEFGACAFLAVPKRRTFAVII